MSESKFNSSYAVAIPGNKEDSSISGQGRASEYFTRCDKRPSALQGLSQVT